MSPKLKCDAWQPKSDSHTGHTHSLCKPSYFHAKQWWNKTDRRGGLAEMHGQKDGKKLEQICKTLLW